MRCGKAKALLASSVIRSSLESHLAECEECSRFAARLEEATRVLGERPPLVTPDAGFAARVVARLPERDPLLGLAAIRMLPAAAALLLVLGIWALLGTSTPSELTTASPTDDLVAWVLARGENGDD
jgi:hypothetical protein